MVKTNQLEHTVWLQWMAYTHTLGERNLFAPKLPLCDGNTTDTRHRKLLSPVSQSQVTHDCVYYNRTPL